MLTRLTRKANSYKYSYIAEIKLTLMSPVLTVPTKHNVSWRLPWFFARATSQHRSGDGLISLLMAAGTLSAVLLLTSALSSVNRLPLCPEGHFLVESTLFHTFSIPVSILYFSSDCRFFRGHFLRIMDYVLGSWAIFLNNYIEVVSGECHIFSCRRLRPCDICVYDCDEFEKLPFTNR